MSSSPWTPTDMFPRTRNAIPPNIFFSTTPGRLAIAFRTRAASVSSYAMIALIV